MLAIEGRSLFRNRSSGRTYVYFASHFELKLNEKEYSWLYLVNSSRLLETCLVTGG